MVTEDRLIGWMIAELYNYAHDAEGFNMPKEVSNELVRRGWVKCHDTASYTDAYSHELTEKGRMVLDLNAADWGVQLAYVEDEDPS